MLAHTSIFPNQMFVNLLSDLAIRDLIAACSVAADRHPELADVYQDCKNHLLSAQSIRAAVAGFNKM